MAVTYEWDVEQLYEYPDASNNFDPDIFDHNFCDSYAEALYILNEIEQDEDTRYGRIVLVRNVGNDLEGLTDRAWAYIVNGELPDTFTYGADEDSGISVPMRFHKEIRNRRNVR